MENGTMRRTVTLALCVVGVCGLLATASAAEQKLRDASLSADKLKFNYSKKTIEMTGNCRVSIKNADQAMMLAPRITASLAPKTNQLQGVTASGPVKFVITPKKDADGVTHKIDAQARGAATYDSAKRLVTLSGGATATIVTLPEEPGIEPTRFTGKTLTLNLDSFDIEGEEVEIQAQLPAEEEAAADEGGASPVEEE